jgi:tetratricopeptide (TPR) repeat protein
LAVSGGVGVLAWANEMLAKAASQPSPESPRVYFTPEARARNEEHQRAYRLIGERNDEARDIARRMIDRPTHDRDIVEGMRLLSQVARSERDYPGADAYLLAALAVVDQHETIRLQDPSAHITIVMDRADLAAFGAKDYARAIELYDEVISNAATARPRDVWIAAQNAAMLCERLGRHEEAVRRVDALLASPAAAEIPRNDLPMLRASQASWIASHGNLVEAQRRYMAIWADFQGRDDQSVLQAGVILAGWTPQPGECAERLEWCRLLLGRFQAIRNAPAAHPDAPTASELDSLEHQVLIHIANSTECPDLDFVNRARSRLGLPPIGP